jgi:phage terminase large subunit-like protein
LAGRSFGKTRCGAEWVRSLAEAGATSHIALVAATAADARDTMIEGPAGLLSIAPNSFRPIFEPSKRRLTYPNGCQAIIFACEEPDQLRGPQHAAAWLDELAKFKNLQDTWDNLQMGMRIGRHPRQVVTTTPRPLKLLRELIVASKTGSDVVVTKGSTYDNRGNLPDSYITAMRAKYEGTRLGRQELNAEILDDTPGALWSRDLIEKTRRKEAPLLTRIVVAIDPAVSVGEDADETGIIVAGIDDRGEVWIIADASGKYSPTEWARIAIGLYKHHRADRIVAEANQGGQMVENTLRMIDRNVPFKAVHASRGKLVRAEPVSAIWEQGRGHLVGAFPELEDQLCSYAPGQSTGNSPDRLDAMVWAVTELAVAAPRVGQFVFGALDKPDDLEIARRHLSTDHYHQ